nr:bone morphogenetic protein 4 [Leptinotarsa decemlineata]
MGGIILAYLAAWWTLFYLLALSGAIVSADQGLLQDLGFNVLPDISKINISLDEYTTMMNTYLHIRQKSGDDATTIPKLLTFDVDQKVVWKRKVPSIRLRFPLVPDPEIEVEDAHLRLLAPPQLHEPATVKVQVNLVLGARKRRLLEERILYLSKNSTKWCEVDVTSAVQSWFSGNINLGLELVCLDFNCRLNPQRAAITSLVHSGLGRRTRRASPYQSGGKTDCPKGKGKRKCCRQNMKVNFTKLDFPEMNFILQPKTYEAGYCHGLCPPDFNHATNHSRIQSLMRQMEHKSTSRRPKKIPKACCAPSKLGSLDILLINKDNPSKLMVEKWDNMVVEECACS